MSWLKPSLYIVGVLIVVFGGALVLDRAAPMLGLAMWLPNRQQTHVPIEIQYFHMWSEVQQTPPDSSEITQAEENPTEPANRGKATNHLDIIKR